MSGTLAARLRQETRESHTAAERSGIMRRLLTRTLDLPTYVALLRNLLPVYRELEAQLDQHRADQEVSAFHHPGLARSSALEQDLLSLGGPQWRLTPVTDEANAYADRIRSAGATDPALLVAHSYVRYLGDMSGGQILKKIVAEGFSLAPGVGIAFYEFPAIGDLDGFKQQYRAALDGLVLAPPRADGLVQEALTAFAANTRLFEALERNSQLAS